MASSLSNLVNNLSERLRRIKCKFRHGNRNCETFGIKYKYCNCFLEYTNFKDDLTEYKCLSCTKSYQQKLDEKFKERLFNTYKFSNHDNNKFILLYKKVLSLRIYWWLGKIQWNNVTWKRRFLKSLKYGRYYWCRLCASKKSF